MATPKPMYAVGIDAGSRRTRVVICAYENGRIRFLGAGVAESQGWLKGRIADQNAVADSVLGALRAAEQSAGGISVGGFPSVITLTNPGFICEPWLSISPRIRK